MSNTVFDQMLSRYTIQTEDDRINALHEVMQQVTLAGLYRAGFFNKTAFYGGTCLRIFLWKIILKQSLTNLRH